MIKVLTAMIFQTKRAAGFLKQGADPEHVEDIRQFLP